MYLWIAASHIQAIQRTKLSSVTMELLVVQWSEMCMVFEATASVVSGRRGMMAKHEHKITSLFPSTSK